MGRAGRAVLHARCGVTGGRLPRRCAGGVSRCGSHAGDAGGGHGAHCFGCLPSGCPWDAGQGRKAGRARWLAGARSPAGYVPGTRFTRRWDAVFFTAASSGLLQRDFDAAVQRGGLHGGTRAAGSRLVSSADSPAGGAGSAAALVPGRVADVTGAPGLNSGAARARDRPARLIVGGETLAGVPEGSYLVKPVASCCRPASPAPPCRVILRSARPPSPHVTDDS
jgi:hypothetical protein